MKPSSNTADMTKGSPVRLILTFSIPLIIGNIFQQLYNMVDTVVVGNFVVLMRLVLSVPVAQ